LGKGSPEQTYFACPAKPQKHQSQREMTRKVKYDSYIYKLEKQKETNTNTHRICDQKDTHHDPSYLRRDNESHDKLISRAVEHKEMR
jgi:hypothetical protein